MKKIIILQGIPGSGKTTWAKEFVKGKDDWVRINRDDLRNMRGDYWVPTQEDFISAIEFESIRAAIIRSLNIVLDSTNLNPKHLDVVIDFINTCIGMYDIKYSVEFKMINTPLDICIERDSKRERPVGEKVIRSFYDKYCDN